MYMIGNSVSRGPSSAAQALQRGFERGTTSAKESRSVCRALTGALGDEYHRELETVASATLGRSENYCMGARSPSSVNGA